jgi:hypothetical protein
MARIPKESVPFCFVGVRDLRSFQNFVSLLFAESICGIRVKYYMLHPFPVW